MGTIKISEPSYDGVSSIDYDALQNLVVMHKEDGASEVISIGQRSSISDINIVDNKLELIVNGDEKIEFELPSDNIEYFFGE